ncbi:MAG: enoyl-CoA hydratase-related protein, partial [Gammaproteobacteria bacterium]|nr:enoyl-CoA hydratase-related protein [Gammaproteobacteria bacterium]
MQGAAIGIGTTLLLHCDLIYAADDAVFALPFVDLALVPEAGSSLLLPQIAGYPRAAELLLLGEPFDAHKAKEMGLINAVVGVAELAETTAEVVAKLAAKPPQALRRSKPILYQALFAPGSRAPATKKTAAARHSISSDEDVELVKVAVDEPGVGESD